MQDLEPTQINLESDSIQHFTPEADNKVATSHETPLTTVTSTQEELAALRSRMTPNRENKRQIWSYNGEQVKTLPFDTDIQNPDSRISIEDGRNLKPLARIDERLLNKIEAYLQAKPDSGLDVQEIGIGAEKIVYRCVDQETETVFTIKRSRPITQGGEQLGGLDFSELARVSVINGETVSICEYIQGTDVGEPFFCPTEMVEKTTDAVSRGLLKVAQAFSTLESNVLFWVAHPAYVRGNSSDTVPIQAHYMLEENTDSGIPLPCLRKGVDNHYHLTTRRFRYRQIDS